MKQDLQNFYSRWLSKINQYQEGILEDEFDKYISRYIVFNSLYNEIGLRIGTENWGDHYRATDNVLRFFSDNNYVDEISEQFSENELSSLAQIISGYFHITFRLSKSEGRYIHNKTADNKLLSELKSAVSLIRIKAILELLYQIRCNIFHGTKDFELVQLSLLERVNPILNKILVFVHSKLEE